MVATNKMANTTTTTEATTHKRNEPVSEFVVNNFPLDRKIKEACAGMKSGLTWLMKELPRDEDRVNRRLYPSMVQ